MRRMMSTKFLANAVSLYRNCSTITSSYSVVQKANKTGNLYEKNELEVSKPTLRWTDEQEKVLDHVRRGLSVFITGSAGTGKTALVRHIIKILEKTYGEARVLVTAPTGVAACALQGQTLHSFAGIGLGNGDRYKLLDRVLDNGEAQTRCNMADALVIDEISMVNADLFDNLEFIARKVRRSDKVWGGVRLIVSGDFFQLPPILKQKTKCQIPEDKEFAFEADCWDASFDIQVELTKIFRQSEC